MSSGFEHIRSCEVAVLVAPDLKTLIAFRIKVGATMVEDYLSYHNAVTVVLRALAVHNHEIIACPGWNNDDFFLVMTEERAKENGWRDNLTRHDMEIAEQLKPVPENVFVNSVWYSIVCRMAPEWNRVGRYLVQGCDFLRNMNGRKYRGLELAVEYLPPDRMRFILTVHTITMSQLTAKNFEKDPAVMDVISGKAERIIFSRDRQKTYPCFVLPRETRGFILALSKTLPKRSEFENYEELREYWKSMYGYSLPMEEPSFYCDVVFEGPSKTIFTYPSYCLLSTVVQASKITYPYWGSDDRPICIKAFATDLFAKMPCLCGAPLKMTHLPHSVTCRCGVPRK